MPRKPRVEVYRDAADEWRWRRVAGNGEVVADSGEGYVSQENAVRAALSANDAEVEIVVLSP